MAKEKHYEKSLVFSSSNFAGNLNPLKVPVKKTCANRDYSRRSQRNAKFATKKSLDWERVVVERFGPLAKNCPGDAHPGHVQQPQQRVQHHQQGARTHGGQHAHVRMLPVERRVDFGAEVAAGAAAQEVDAREDAVRSAHHHRLVHVQNAHRVAVHQQLHQHHHRVQQVLVDVEEIHCVRSLKKYFFLDF